MDEVRVPCNNLGTPATSHRLVFDYFAYFPPILPHFKTFQFYFKSLKGVCQANLPHFLIFFKKNIDCLWEVV